MKKILLTYTFLFFTSFEISFAQTNSENSLQKPSNAQLTKHQQINGIYMTTEVPPTFKNGVKEMYDYIQLNIKKTDRKLTGKVFLRFVVNETGKIDDVNIIKSFGKGGEEYDKEAIRVISSMPNWNPGTIGGKSVSCFYSLPVFFN